MQWDEFVCSLSDADRARLVRLLEEGRQYAGITAGQIGSAEVEQIVACLDQALDALAAARLLLQAPVEPQPWRDPAYRAYRTSHPTTTIHLRPSELEALRAMARDAGARRAAERGPAAGTALRRRGPAALRASTLG
jgi:hypothetical protein